MTPRFPKFHQPAHPTFAQTVSRRGKSLVVLPTPATNLVKSTIRRNFEFKPQRTALRQKKQILKKKLAPINKCKRREGELRGLAKVRRAALVRHKADLGKVRRALVVLKEKIDRESIARFGSTEDVAHYMAEHLGTNLTSERIRGIIEKNKINTTSIKMTHSERIRNSVREK